MNNSHNTPGGHLCQLIASTILIAYLHAIRDRVQESLIAMQDAIKMLSLGIDYRKYSRFKNLTPYIRQLADRRISVKQKHGENNMPSNDDVQFCIDFVIESSLVLSEFDYTIGETQKPTLEKTRVRCCRK